MTSSRLPLLGTAAGVAVGTAVAAALVATGTLWIPARRDTSDASADFLAAWDHSRHASYVVESDFRRTMGDGRKLYSVTLNVQRPPDEMVREFGGIKGNIGGHPIVCSTAQTGKYACSTGAATAAPYDDEVRDELDVFRSYFTPQPPATSPLYRVIHSPDAGCFELFQQIVYPNPAYGHYAKLCFDPVSGALSRLERQLDDGVIETQEATAIRTGVSPTDFDTKQDTSFELGMDLGPVGAPTPPGTVAAGSTPPGTTTGSTPPGTAPAFGHEPASRRDLPTDTLPGESGSAPPGSTSSAPAPTTTVAPPPTLPPAPTDLTQLSDQQLIDQGSGRVAGGGEVDPFVHEAMRRLVGGTLSINDPRWRSGSGALRPFAEPVLLELLRRGYGPPTA